MILIGFQLYKGYLLQLQNYVLDAQRKPVGHQLRDDQGQQHRNASGGPISDFVEYDDHRQDQPRRPGDHRGGPDQRLESRVELGDVGDALVVPDGFCLQSSDR